MASTPGILQKFQGFRGQLALWFGGLSLATLLSAGLYLGRIATQELADSAGESLYAGARSAADLLATNLRERDQEIRLLRQAPLFTRGDLAGADVQQALQLRQQAHEAYAWIGVADVSGRVLRATGGLLAGQQVAQRPWFQAALKGPYTGDIHEALLLARLLPAQDSAEPLRFIDFAAPILDDQGRIRGVLGAHAHWSWVTRTVESVVRQSLQREVEVLIADQAGHILYPQAKAAQLQLPVRVAPSKHFETMRWPDGRDYLTSAAHVQAETSTPLGWQIVLRQPLDAALRPVAELRERLLLLGLLTALLFAALAYRLATRISRPIEQLARTVRQLEQRDARPVYPVGPQPREVAQLTQSIRSMTASVLQHEEALRQLNASLEQQVRERTQALTEANAQLEKLATIDFLTGLHNRRSFNTRLLESFQLLRRSGRGFCIVLVDVDHFKRINDTHGHPVGDDVLRLLGRMLTKSVRITDFVGRYGGEEFVVLVPDVQDNQQGYLLAEKIRQAVAQVSFPGVGQLTVSVGLSCARPEDDSANAVLRRADEALYEAKGQGRNRTVTA